MSARLTSHAPTRRSTAAGLVTLLVWVSAVVALGACNTPRAVDAPPPPEVVVLEPSLVVRTGPIGVKDKMDGTYVFVDVQNGTTEDRDVSVIGDLYDATGTAIEALSLDEVRVPAGGQRTFALVAPVVVPPTTTARVRVRQARVASAQPSVLLSMHPLVVQGDHPVQVVTVRSVVRQDGFVTVATTFRDDAGKILSRPFVILELRGNRSRDFDFLGPVGATRAESFVTETVH